MVFVVVDFAVVVLLSFWGFCFEIDLLRGAAILVRSLTMKSTKVDS